MEIKMWEVSVGEEEVVEIGGYRRKKEWKVIGIGMGRNG